MLDSDIEIRFNFRQLKFKWKTVFHLKNETQALVVKQIFIKLKWGESKGAGFERVRVPPHRDCGFWGPETLQMKGLSSPPSTKTPCWQQATAFLHMLLHVF